MLELHIGFIRLKDGTETYVHQSVCTEPLFMGALCRLEIRFGEHSAQHDRFSAHNCTVVDTMPHTIYVIGDTPVLSSSSNPREIIARLEIFGLHFISIAGPLARPALAVKSLE